jgi:hypothetical protein
MILNIVIALCIFFFGIPLAISVIGGLIALIAQVVDSALKGLHATVQEVLHYRPSKVSATVFIVTSFITGTFVLFALADAMQMNTRIFLFSYSCGAGFGLVFMFLIDEVLKMRKRPPVCRYCRKEGHGIVLCPELKDLSLPGLKRKKK